MLVGILLGNTHAKLENEVGSITRNLVRKLISCCRAELRLNLRHFEGAYH